MTYANIYQSFFGFSLFLLLLNMNKEDLVSIIKKRRKELGLNQQQFAALIGVKSKQIISNIENGNLSVERMLIIFDKLEIEMILQVKLKP